MSTPWNTRFLPPPRRRSPARLLACVCAAALLAGCGKGAAAALPTASPAPAAETAQPAKQAVALSPSPSPSPSPAPTALAAADAVALVEGPGSAEAPLDLTTMSATMVYAEVTRLVTTPEDSVGRTITMAGQFAAYKGNPNNEFGSPYYFAVVIADATACCQLGVEFVLPETFSYPGDYPAEGADVTVTGIWQPYTEGEAVYYHLVAKTFA